MTKVSRVKMLATCYMRENFIFECLQPTYFSTLLRIVGDAEDVQTAIKNASEKRINHEPLCKIYKVKEI